MSGKSIHVRYNNGARTTMSRTVALVLALISLCLSLPISNARSSESLVPELASSSDSHTRLCHCAGCTGGIACCCLHAATAAQSVAMSANCNSRSRSTLNGTALQYAVLPVCLPLVAEVEMHCNFAPNTQAYLQDEMLPSYPPPKLSPV